MSTPLQSKYTPPGPAIPEWVDSEKFRFVTGGVTLDSAAFAADGNGDKIVESGTVIVKQANGKWAEAPADAPTIAGRYVALLWERVNLRDGDAMSGAVDEARVIGSRLPAVPSADQLAAMGGNITVR